MSKHDVDVVDVSDDATQQPLDFVDLPVDDDTYVPTNGRELANAAKLALSDVEDEDVEETWQLVRKIKDKMTKTSSKVETEGFVRGIVRGCLSEASRDPDAGEPSPEELDAIEQRSSRKWGRKSEPDAVFAMSDADADMLASIRTAAGMDKADVDADDEDIDVDLSPAKPKDASKKTKKYNTAGEDGAALDALAQVFGFAGASGVKNLLYRVEDQVKYFSSLDEIWFKDLMDKLAAAYIEELIDALTHDEKGRKAGEADPDDVEFLLDLSERPDDVIVQPNFRAWSHDFIMDFYRKNKGKKAPASYASSHVASKSKKSDGKEDAAASKKAVKKQKSEKKASKAKK